MRPPSSRCTCRNCTSWFSVAEYSRIGTFTRPKDTAPFQIARIPSIFSYAARSRHVLPRPARPLASAKLPASGAKSRTQARMGGMRPMLATPVAAVPRGAGWVHEVKWDGVRVLADVRGGALTLTSRAENDVTAGYPELQAV